jgi:hypothetical protein
MEPDVSSATTSARGARDGSAAAAAAAPARVAVIVVMTSTRPGVSNASDAGSTAVRTATTSFAAVAAGLTGAEAAAAAKLDDDGRGGGRAAAVVATAAAAASSRDDVAAASAAAAAPATVTAVGPHPGPTAWRGNAVVSVTGTKVVSLLSVHALARRHHTSQHQPPNLFQGQLHVRVQVAALHPRDTRVYEQLLQVRRRCRVSRGASRRRGGRDLHDGNVHDRVEKPAAE